MRIKQISVIRFQSATVGMQSVALLAWEEALDSSGVVRHPMPRVLNRRAYRNRARVIRYLHQGWSTLLFPRLRTAHHRWHRDQTRGRIGVRDMVVEGVRVNYHITCLEVEREAIQAPGRRAIQVFPIGVVV